MLRVISDSQNASTETMDPSFTMPDYGRAFFHIATHGKQGFSPHITSDVLKLLAEKVGANAISTIGVGSAYMAFSLRLNNGESWPIHVTFYRRDDHTWCFISDYKGNSALSFKATTTVDIPCLFVAADDTTTFPVQDIFKYFNWFEMWPEKTKTFDTFASEMMGQPLRTVGITSVPFFSETDIYHAIMAFLTIRLPHRLLPPALLRQQP